MEKVWIRLGGFVTADAKTIEKIKNGDEEALVKVLKEQGFEVNGDSYIPDPDGEVEFDLNPMVLTFFRNGQK